MSVCDQISSWVHPPKPAAAGVESAHLPSSFWGPWPQLLLSNPVVTHPGGLLPDPYMQLQVKQAAIAVSVSGKVTPVILFPKDVAASGSLATRMPAPPTLLMKPLLHLGC